MRSASGSSLIECLVAMAVFAIGAACNATWTMQSMAAHARASRLNAATTIAASLVAHIRANPEGTADYDDERADDTGMPRAPSAGSRSDAHRHATNEACDASCLARRLARDDVLNFHAELARRVGSAAAGRVACDAARCTITVTWADRPVLAWTVHP
ncbi:prepilin-type N-terminal cleavage/methylation domain-containing protein [Luteibacter sp. UNCMF366Tsu5.1]|uniref:prepilin-type N-terminal cleavage/methylation domain-containing protein n=1 Tax=Luteibacter sp. UNCMF366Tsu5.1 TaxID=1502758 RepID=UPI0009310FFB|nr:prepilin-type N-terminal cleavage/methylation domain-containing protein [Luteibacter sp. UNCMF366Tsu5.1]